MTAEEIEMELEMNNVTVDMSELLINEDNNTVAVHTELFNDATLVWRTRAKSLGIRPSFWYFCVGILLDC